MVVITAAVVVDVQLVIVSVFAEVVVHDYVQVLGAVEMIIWNFIFQIVVGFKVV